MATLKVLPQEKAFQVPVGTSVFSALQEAGIFLASDCGGQGRCGLCRVRFLGPLPSVTETDAQFLSPEELAAGWRLACRHQILRDVTVELPSPGSVSQAKLKGGSFKYQDALRPAAVKRKVFLPQQDRSSSYLERLQFALGEEVEVPRPVLSQLTTLKGNLCTVTMVGRKAVAVEPGESRDGPYGLAVDLGTSTVAAYFLDLGQGEVTEAKAAANPQGAFGADVLSRISCVQEWGSAGLQKLQRAAIGVVNCLAEELAEATGISTEKIVQAAVVGNPTMLHLLLGIDPTSIGQAPFIPVWRQMLAFRAGDLSLSINPEALVHFLPLVSGYIGADTVAGILACRMHRTPKTELLLDVGANAEMVLAVEGRLVACAAAAGPAFEGVGISCGMPAFEGAICRVEIDGDIRYWTVGDASPQGICGTGLVDAVAGLLEAGFIDYQGRLQGKWEERIQGERNACRFTIGGDPPIYITQGDIRKLQLAKAAIRAGMEVLMAHVGLSLGEVDRVFLTGAFGSELRPQSLARIGLLPSELLSHTVIVRNAAGEGAKAFLFDKELAQEVERIARRMEYIDLSSDKRFSLAFVNAMWFPRETE